MGYYKKRGTAAGKLMKLSTQTLVADNVVELLEKIVEFTSRRHELLTENILNIVTEDYIPMDMNVEGFADIIANAVAEHIANDRIVLRDIENITFGEKGDFQCPAFVDHQSHTLLQKDVKGYLRHQIRKYSENLLNKKIASELLKQRQNVLQMTA
jgi:hypothetical protein